MILSFSTKFKNGELTNFVSKIWAGLKKSGAVGPAKLAIFRDRQTDENKQHLPSDLWVNSKERPKLHTIREDKHNRWHAGVKIHFIIFPRSKRMFQFAPEVPCTSTQKIEIGYMPITGSIHYLLPYPASIEVDGRVLSNTEIESLAINDGFDCVEDFFDWFNTDYNGKIIHWTGLTY